ncbi:cytochrome c3 family protein [Bacteroidota bacterium]
MKRLNFIFTFLFVFLLGSYSYSQITGTAHDFSGESWTGEICNVCHTPHNANGQTGAPLWDHTATATSFTLYTSTVSPSFDGTMTQPGGTSKMCLSCHDNTVNVDAFGGGAGTVTASSFGASNNLGTDLSTHHPVSFTYNDALATTDGGLHPPTTTSSGLVDEIDDDLLFGAGNDQMECASCHDVHGAGQTSLLVMSNALSALCLTCHDK